MKDLDPQERRDVEEDDILLWRAIFVFMVSRYVRQANGRIQCFPGCLWSSLHRHATSCPRWSASGTHRSGRTCRKSSGSQSFTSIRVSTVGS